MRRYVKPNQSSLPPPSQEAKALPDPALADISVESLLESCLLILFREVRNLTMLSVHGKLSPADARDLRDHTKLLWDFKLQREAEFAEMTEAQIQEKAQAIEKKG